MAERRMFAKTIVLSDAFLDMPMSARCLYFTLGMFADDDGFVNAPKAIMRQCGASEDDMRVLEAKKFVISFESGVIVIKHWRINNYLRNDRYTETKHTNEKDSMIIESNGAYHLKNSEESIGIPSSGIPSIGKDSIDKNSIEKNNNTINHSQNDIDMFFNNVWKLYPKKKGKGQVTKSKKKILFDLGYETVAKCVERYVEWFSSTGSDRQYMMHGSTFFNSGYEDYLDENYDNAESSSDANANGECRQAGGRQ